MVSGFLGVVLLLLSASFLETYADIGQPHRIRAAYTEAGALICGAAMLVSSFVLYRRRSNATILYGGSWTLNLIGWIALGLSHHRPVWWVLATSMCFAIGAVVFVVDVRRALVDHRLGP
jgi:hypothetical protein